MKLIFLGTPAFAVPVLEALQQSTHEVLAVISQPDREKDKKGRLLPTAVRACAERLNLKCYAFDRVSKDGIETLRALNPDLLVTAAYGQLLSEEVLAVPKYGTFNVHASLLPKYRGSSPIQAALLNGDKTTGVTVMKTELKMDTGDILLQRRLPVLSDDNSDTLQEKLSRLGAELIVETIDRLAGGSLTAIKQDDEKATYTKKILKSDGLIDWCNAAGTIRNKIFAFNPWPSAYTFYEGKNIKIYGAEVVPGARAEKCGEILSADVSSGLVVQCGTDRLKITCLQAPGKKKLVSSEFLKGFRLERGKFFENQAE